MRRGVARLATALAVVGVAWCGVSQAAEEQFIGGNVDSLLEYARDRHPEFAAMRHEAAAAAARVEAADAFPDPVFRTELRDISRQNSSGSTKYTAVQTMPWYGKRELRREVAAAGADEAAVRARATWIELATRIKRTYAEHHVHSFTLRLLRDNLDLLTRLTDIAQARYSGGLGAQQEVIRAQTERAMLQSEVVALEGESRQASARIRALLGWPPQHVKLHPPEKLRALPPAAQLDFAQLEQRLLASSPQLATDAARIAAADKGRELTYRNRYPDVSVGLSPIQTNTRVSEWEVMFELNIPLQQDSRRAQERESERMLEAAMARREASSNQARADLAEALAGLLAAQRVEEVLNTQVVPQAELNWQSALVGYENGKLEFAMVLESLRQIRRAQQDLVKARGDQQLRLADMERLIGETL